MIAMHDNLVRVAAFANSGNAWVAKNRLEAEGIAACLENEATARWFWHFGTALGGVKLLVAKADLARALEILAARQVDLSGVEPEADQPRQPKAWDCPNCGAEVDAGLEACWACGTTIDGEADPDFEVATAPIVEVDEDAPPSPGFAILLILCPPLLILYLVMKLLFSQREESTRAGKRVSAAAGPTDSPPGAERLPADADQPAAGEVSRHELCAWRAAVIGIAFFPPLTSLYSIYVLLAHGLLPGRRSRRTTWRTPAAMLINLAVIALAGVVLWLLLSSMRFSPPPLHDGQPPKYEEKTVSIPLVPG
jgi:hypothetical protein